MAHNDRRHAIDTYFRIVQQHSDFVERTQDTFNSIESHVYDIINNYNDDINETNIFSNIPPATPQRSTRNRNPVNNRTSSHTRNSTTHSATTTNTNNRPLFGNINNNNNNNRFGSTRSPFMGSGSFNEPGISRRRSPAYTSSQSLLDTITLWALFPNGVGGNATNLDNLSPVVIHPSEAQMVEAIENMTFSEVIDPVNRTCPISQDEFQENDDVSVIRHCGHIFRQEDVQTWFRSNVRCPLCRYDIREYRRGGGGALSRQNSVRQLNRSTNSNSNNDIDSDTDDNNVNTNVSATQNESPPAAGGGDSNTNANNANANANASANANANTNNASANVNTNNAHNTGTFMENNIYGIGINSFNNNNNWLDLINENLSNVLQSSDISDNINVNFEYSYIIPHNIQDPSNNNI